LAVASLKKWRKNGPRILLTFFLFRCDLFLGSTQEEGGNKFRKKLLEIEMTPM